MFCSKCGAEISKDATFCSACGAAQNETKSSSAPNTAEPQKESYNTLCIIGFVLAMLSFTPFLFITTIETGLVFAALGLVVSAIGLASCGKKNQKGKPLAIAGIIIGLFFLAMALRAII